MVALLLRPQPAPLPLAVEVAEAEEGKAQPEHPPYTAQWEAPLLPEGAAAARLRRLLAYSDRFGWSRAERDSRQPLRRRGGTSAVRRVT